MPTATDERLGADLASFRGEVAREFNGLAEFRGEVKNDLRWIKGIGITLLLAAFSFAGWVISDMATVKSEVRQQEARLDRIEKKIDTLIERTAPKVP
jgi:hypothetical protein